MGGRADDGIGGLLCLFDPRYRKRVNPQKMRRRLYEAQSIVNSVDYLPAIAAALLWQLARNAEGDDPTNLESALIGKPVPKFRLESLDNPGQFYQADVLTQGKPVLLNVWATWCPTCRAEHQYLNQLSAQGIRVVGMNYKDDRQKAISWLKELGNPYALSLFDGDGMLGLDLGVYGAPETFLIDGNGIIRYRHAGDLNPRVWEEEIKPLWEKYSKEAAQ
ncbi:thiol:disulfide interchange protein DsbE [Escherichia coli]|nr:thiol:disulfide interchange protein DsbE [Escherichia coli]